MDNYLHFLNFSLLTNEIEKTIPTLLLRILSKIIYVIHQAVNLRVTKQCDRPSILIKIIFRFTSYTEVSQDHSDKSQSIQDVADQSTVLDIDYRLSVRYRLPD